MNSYIKICFTHLESELKEILLAKLADKGFDGFEERENELDAFMPEENYTEELLSDLQKEYNFDFTKHIIKEENWNQLWESNFHPVIVDDFVAVRADFHQPIGNVQHEIIITPKMSFGTGHHATTKMMMQQMRTINFHKKKVFDYGTGTGILAILAEKSGAESVLAIDIDEWSITNALENFKKNNCSAIHLELAGRPLPGQMFDIILANINKNIILENLPYLSRQLNKNGTLLLSGFLKSDEEDILKTGKINLLKPGMKITDGNWLCMRFLR